MGTTTSITTTANTSTSLFERLSNSRGRFFGLYLKNGEKINAQFRGQTERTLMVYDRNNSRNRRIVKTSVDRATI